MATHFVAAAKKTFRELHGVVVSSGLMQKTVKVRVGGQIWNKRVQKFFNRPETYLVHDPNDSLRTGDAVAISPGWRMSKNKRHVVKRIIAPAHVPIDERPPVPSEEQRWEEAIAKRAAKNERRSLIKAAEEARKLEEITSRRTLRKLAKKKAKAEAAEQAETVKQAEAEMRGDTSL
ncbi:hypothetical protein SPBR_07880 [Sporothrix brasiliensis 5110]|uniref:Small subunit ribosomal protein S17 n=1 Tax=Sporothrix brasiliensis 5110 TaxID=1398154 RepID=A0A0C2ERW7_9PEZI|nr:uncharacterized protein SPBR_07880 [Sporothrix brasiliensis 5110]KIH89094.1 hypothetical protein SPBR_07880 [Sporothrix brasiliensis 5110]